MLIMWRLGAPLGLPVVCTACGACRDAFGDHTLSCTAVSIYSRHNIIRDTVASLATSAGLQCRTEVRHPGTELVPADVFLPSLSDVSVAAVGCSPAAPFTGIPGGGDGRCGCRSARGGQGRRVRPEVQGALLGLLRSSRRGRRRLMPVCGPGLFAPVNPCRTCCR